VGLMRFQQNALFDAIAGSGLDTDDFALATEEGATYVRHWPSKSAFSISTPDGVSFYGNYKVGAAGWYRYEPTEWQLLLIDHFDPWIRLVKREAETPDKWEMLRTASEFLDRLGEAELINTPFTPAEQSQIADTLNEIKNYLIESRSLSEAQTESIKQKIEHAERASEHFGRKDWLGMLLGILLSVALSAVLPPDAIQQIFLMAGHGLGHLFGGPGPGQLPPRR
jgi:hypothetical protein